LRVVNKEMHSSYLSALPIIARRLPADHMPDSPARAQPPEKEYDMMRLVWIDFHFTKIYPY
jgi:hypothetical protein